MYATRLVFRRVSPSLSPLLSSNFRVNGIIGPFVSRHLQPLFSPCPSVAFFSTQIRDGKQDESPKTKEEKDVLEEGGIGDPEMGTHVHNSNLSYRNLVSQKEMLEEGGIGDHEMGTHVHNTNLSPPKEQKGAVSSVYYHHDRNPNPIYGPKAEGKHPGWALGIFTGINLFILLKWQVLEQEEQESDKDPKVYEVWQGQYDSMLKNFSTNLHNLWEGRVWTLFTAGFSHQTFPHLFGNMFAFWLFGYKTYRALGPIGFTGLYTVGGGMAALAHCGQNWYKGKIDPPLNAGELHQYRQAVRKPTLNPQGGTQNQGKVEVPEHWKKRLANSDLPSLGASGSVMAISAAAAMLFPQDRVITHLGRFLPIPMLLNLPIAVLIYIASDLYGLTLPSHVDHIGHLAGVGTGIVYILAHWYIFGRVHTLSRGHVPLFKFLSKKFYGRGSGRK